MEESSANGCSKAISSIRGQCAPFWRQTFVTFNTLWHEPIRRITRIVRHIPAKIVNTHDWAAWAFVNDGEEMMKRNRICELEQLEQRKLLTVATEFIFDIRPGQRGADIQEVRQFNGELYFRANDGSSGIELWKSDGTPEGTEQVKDIFPGGDQDSSGPGWFTEYKGELYFAARTQNSGSELWKSDGTESGTQRVVDIFDGPGSAFPNELTVFKDEIYFAASVSENDHELWKTDGTAAGTVLVRDINQGEGNSNPGSFSGFYEFNDHLYFNADDGVHGVELWRTDGTPAGTELVFDAETDGDSYPFNFFEFKGDLYFEAEAIDNEFNQWHSFLHRVDGQTGIAEVAVNMPIKFNQPILIAGDHLYFSALRADVGFELFRSDGTDAGTTLVFDVHTGASDANPRNMTKFGDKIVFTAGGSRELDILIHNLWITDGTLLGTKQVSGEQVEPDGNLTEYQGEIYYSAFDVDTGWELYRTDGTPEGTSIVQDINTADADSNAKAQIVFEDQLLFTATNTASGYEIWTWDGETATMTDTGFGAGDFTPEPASFEFMKFGNDLVFLAQNPFEGEELHIIRGSGIVQPERLPGDADEDGIVAFPDFLALSANFGSQNATWELGDFDGDGVVSFPDFLILSANFGKLTAAKPTAVASATGASLERSQVNGATASASLTAITIDHVFALDADIDEEDDE